MNSKEALQKLWVGCKGEAMLEERNTILKDLEVLEILKNHEVQISDLNRVRVVGEYNEYCTLSEFQELTNGQFKRIKEWLENACDD